MDKVAFVWPGDNPPELVMPFMADLAARVNRSHPRAKIWLSFQKFSPGQIDYCHRYLDETRPKWFGGVVAGPSSPPIANTRRRLPAEYGLRHYPDITHCVRAQYPVEAWDPAFAFTLNREPINPRPLHQKLIHDAFAPHTVGSISYSDGCHDDVNKVIWCRAGWDPAVGVRDTLLDYARFHFGADVAEAAADGILALERNWQGPVATNGGVAATEVVWRGLENRAPRLRDNWRWQMMLLRAYYDSYLRHRLIHETRLEEDANAALASAGMRGPDAAVAEALAILKQADARSARPDLRARIVELCEALFKSCGLQSSVKRYGAANAQRGCVLDYVDYPLNNRIWLEDELARIKSMGNNAKKLARIDLIRHWENPGPGSFYDDIGNVAKSPRVIRGESLDTDPTMRRNPEYAFMWFDQGYSKRRPSWHSYMNWPLGLRYEGLEPKASYKVRLTGLGQCRLRIDGQPIAPTLDGREYGEFKEFSVPQELLTDGRLLLTFDDIDEPGINWRQQSRVTEVWLLKR